jgi:hypothetical protein
MGLTTAQRKILGQRSTRVSYLQITAAGRKAIAGGARASRSCAPDNASVEESGLFVVVGSPHQPSLAPCTLEDAKSGLTPFADAYRPHRPSAQTAGRQIHDRHRKLAPFFMWSELQSDQGAGCRSKEKAPKWDPSGHADRKTPARGASHRSHRKAGGSRGTSSNYGDV